MRKCDGSQPCPTCVKYDYDCFYDSHPKRKARPFGLSVEVPRREIPSADSPHASAKDDEAKSKSHLQAIMANSGALFAQSLGLKTESQPAPRLQLFAWNLGVRYEEVSWFTPLQITDILTYSEMNELASTYFAEIDPVYQFISRETVDGMVSDRWLQQQPNEYDSILCGIAALGCLFKERNLVEPQLVQSARVFLE